MVGEDLLDPRREIPQYLAVGTDETRADFTGLAGSAGLDIRELTA